MRKMDLFEAEEIRQKKEREAGERKAYFSGARGKKHAAITLAGYLLAAAIVSVFSAKSLALSKVPTGSMEQTILPGDYVLANRLAYVKREPQRGEIVLFHGEGAFLCKRVVAVAGDEVSFKDGDLYINGERAEEKYLDGEVETNSPKTFSVPEGKCFVLGDNREQSLDSRYWEDPYVPYDILTAKVMVVIPTHIFSPGT